MMIVTPVTKSNQWSESRERVTSDITVDSCCKLHVSLVALLTYIILPSSEY